MSNSSIKRISPEDIRMSSLETKLFPRQSIVGKETINLIADYIEYLEGEVERLRSGNRYAQLETAALKRIKELEMMFETYKFTVLLEKQRREKEENSREYRVT